MRSGKILRMLIVAMLPVTVIFPLANLCAQRSGSVTGKVTDASSGRPIQNAVVTVVGIDVDISTTTAADGNYTLSNVPEGNQLIRVAKYGYSSKQLATPEQLSAIKPDSHPDWARAHAGSTSPERFVAVKPDQSVKNDMALKLLGYLDWARCATVSASSNLRDRYAINDGNPTTGWRPEPGRVRDQWVRLGWDQPINLSAIVVHSSGPLQDYTVQYSMDGKDWVDVKRIISTETGHTHWLETLDLTHTITLKLLRVWINSTREDAVGTIWSIECYKTKGLVTGFVKDSSGRGVTDATVYVYEAENGERGASRLAMKGLTQSEGSYSIPVPEGTVMVTAWLPDSLAVTSNPVDVQSGIARLVPDLVINDRVRESSLIFRDDFNSGPSPRWSPQAGKWRGVDGKYRVDATYRSWGLYSLVGDLNILDSVVEADLLGSDGAVVFRFQDEGGRLVMLVWCCWPFYKGGDITPLGWHDFVGKWEFSGMTDLVIDRNRSKGVHLRGVLIGNKAQGFISDGLITYWTPVVTIQNVLTPGKVGLFRDNEFTRSGPLEEPEFDNFAVRAQRQNVETPFETGDGR